MARRKYTGPEPMPVEGITASSSFEDRIAALQKLMASLGFPVKMVRGGDVSAEDQYAIWESGHTKPGPIRTDKSGRPGDESRHQKGFATANDFAFLKNGQADFGEDNPWDLLGQAAKTVGLEWGGDWGQPYSPEIRDRYGLPPGTGPANLPGKPRSVGEDRPHVQMPRGDITGPGATARAVIASNQQAGRDTLASNEQPPAAAGPRRRDPMASPLGAPPASAAGDTAGGVDNPVRVGPQRRGPLDQLLGTLQRRRGDITLPTPPPPGQTPIPASVSAPMTPPLTLGPLDGLLQSLRQRRGDVNLPSPAAPPPPVAAAAPPPMGPPPTPVRSAAPAPVGMPLAAAAPPPPPAPVAPPAAPEPAPAPAVPASTMFPVVQGQGEMIRVGILPIMLGQEGTDPIVVTIPRATRPEDVQATAIAQALANAPKTVKLPQEGPQEQARVGLSGPAGQFAGLDFGDKGVAGDVMAKAISMTPQMVGAAAQFTPMGRLGYTGAFAIPTGIDAILQAIDKGGVEDIDPTQAVTQGSMGVLGHGVGNIVDRFQQMGGKKIIKALRLSPANVGVPTADIGTGARPAIPQQMIDMFRNIMTRESLPGSGKAGLDMIPETEQWLRSEAQRRGLHGWNELADVLESARQRGNVSAPRLSAWPQENASNAARTGPRTVQFGQWLHNLSPDVLEATARALMAYLTPARYGQTADPAPTGARRRTPPAQ